MTYIEKKKQCNKRFEGKKTKLSKITIEQKNVCNNLKASFDKIKIFINIRLFILNLVSKLQFLENIFKP